MATCPQTAVTKKERRRAKSVEPAFYSVLEVATLFSVSDKLITDEIKRGAIPAIRISNVFRIPCSYVDGVIKSSQQVAAE